MTCITTWGNKGECIAWGKHLNLVLARTGLIVAAARRGVGSTQRLFHATSNNFPRMGKGSLPGSGKILLGSLWSRSEHSHGNCSLPLYTSVINVAPVTVHFLISLLFLVNWSYLNLQSSLFVTPILLFSPKRGRRGEGRSEQVAHGLECFGGNTKWENTIPKP